MQPLLEEAHDEHGDDDGDDVALIALERHVVEAEKRDLGDAAGGHDGVCGRLGCADGGAGDAGQPVSCGLGADDLISGRAVGLDGGRNVPGVDEGGVVGDHADDTAKELVATEDAGSREADENLQEHERGVGERVDEDPPALQGEGTAHGVVDALGEAHEQAGSDDGRDDGHEDVAECLDGALERVLLLGGRGLDLVLGGSGDAGLLDELVVDLVHRAGAVYDLELAGGLKVALGTDGVLDLLLVDLAVVGNDQAESGCAVRSGNDVLRSSHRL